MSQILAGLPNTVLALVGIGLTLFIAKDKLGLEDKINNVRGRIGILVLTETYNPQAMRAKILQLKAIYMVIQLKILECQLVPMNMS